MLEIGLQSPALSVNYVSHSLRARVKIMGYDALNSIQLGYCYRSVIPSN
jgi:hypothetical protein